MAADLDPASFRDLQPPGTDPFGATVAVPGPLYGPSGTPPPTVGLPPRPSVSIPRAPAKPLLSPEAKYFLKVMFAVIGVCVVVILFVWALSAGYQGYQQMGREQEVRALMSAGERYYASQSYQAAIEEFNKVLKVSTDPELTKIARQNTATSYIQLGIGAEKASNPFQAISCYKQALVYDTASADAYVYLGNVLNKLHRGDEALGAWEKAIQVGEGGKAAMAARQNAAVLYHKRGDEAYRQGNTDKAVQWWRKALEIAPGTQAGFLAQEKIDRAIGGG
jgi:Tfp pilus assembly protein PilF